MAEPRTAEECVETFRNEELLLLADDERDAVLVKHFRRYARQVGEAVREQAMRLHEGWHHCESTERRAGGCATMAAIRALPVEAP